MRDNLRFLAGFLRKPAAVGSVVPSSAALARVMVNGCDLGSASTVVELGPGTGSFTGLIRSSLGPSGKFLAVERDPGFAELIRRRFPDVSVQTDVAENVRAHLQGLGRDSADYILSGLPWASLPEDVQVRTLDAIYESLAPGGVFATFAYVHALGLPRARKFRKLLQARFKTVSLSETVWANFPPAKVYRCSRG